MMKRIHFPLILSFLFLFLNAHSQDKDQLTNTDSVNWPLIRQKLQELEVQRLQDADTRARLEQQLNILSNSGNEVQLQSLQQQLDAIRQRDSVRIAEKKSKIDALRASVKGHPVMGPMGIDTLFYIYTRLGSTTSRERATMVTERIAQLANDFQFNPDSIRLQMADIGMELMVRDRILLTITETDAIWNNSSIEELAKQYRQQIIQAIRVYKDETSWITLIKEIGLALLVIFLLLLCIYLGKKLFRFTAKRIIALRGDKLKGYRIRNYTILNTARQLRILLVLNQLVKWIFTIALLYCSLLILFGIFPWTQNFANQLFSWVLNPMKSIGNSVLQYIPNLITIIVIVIVFRYVLKGVSFIKKEIETGALVITGFHADWANPTYQIIRVLLMAFMLIVIFPYLPGSDTPVFRGVSVFLGVLFTFGSSGSLNNIVSGLILTYMRSYKIGDHVKIGEVNGDIIEKTILVTRIRTINNEIISIPNANVMNSHTINYSSDAQQRGLIIHSTVTIGYATPWTEVHTALIKAATMTTHILPYPAPYVLQKSLDDFYVSYQINAYTRESNIQHFIYSELHQHIQDCCREAGIEIMSPHYRALRDGDASTIPDIS